MPSAIKSWMADEVRGLIDDNPDFLVVGLLPMNAEQTVELRTKIRSEGGHLKVVHNRTSRHALGDARQALADYFKGQTAIAVGGEIITVAKVIADAQKKKLVELRGGYVEGDVLNTSDANELANIPDKDTLRGMLAGTVVAPGRGIVTTLNAVMAGIARCLKQRSEQDGQTTE